MHEKQNQDKILAAKVAKILNEREEVVMNTAYIVCIEKLVQENEKLNNYLIQRDRALDELKTENKELINLKNSFIKVIYGYTDLLVKKDQELQELKKGRVIDKHV
jgi:hypothetical protein